MSHLFVRCSFSSRFCEFLVYVIICLGTLYDIYVQGNREHTIKPVNFKDSFDTANAYVLRTYYIKMSSLIPTAYSEYAVRRGCGHIGRDHVTYGYSNGQRRKGDISSNVL